MELSKEMYDLVVQYIKTYYRYRSLYEMYAYDVASIPGITYDKERVDTTVTSYDTKLVCLAETSSCISDAFKPVEDALKKVPEHSKINLLKLCSGRAVPHIADLYDMKNELITEVANNLFSKEFLYVDAKYLSKYRKA